MATAFAPRQLPSVDRLYKAVGADFDHDGWFELCGWANRQLVALDPVARTPLWTLGGFTDEHDLFAGPGRVYVSTEAELIAIDATTGTRLWTLAIYNAREVHDPGAVIPGASLWVLTREDKLVAVDRDTGTRRASYTAYDSVSLFRTLVGRRLVVNDASSLRILDATSPTVHDIVNLDEMIKKLDAGEMITQVAASLDSAVVHRGVLYAVINDHGLRLEAIRVADGSVIARRPISTETKNILGVVAGHPITGDDEGLFRQPDGPAWAPSGDDEPRIVSARAAGRMLIVHVRRTGPGNDRQGLVGLDPTTMTPVWQIDHVGHLMSDIFRTDEHVVFAIDLGSAHQIICIDPASGAKRWEALVPANQGLQIAGGLIVQASTGTTLLLESGEQIFPADQRRAPTPPVGPTPIGEELPTWTTLAFVEDRTRLWPVFAVLAAIAAIVAFVLAR